MFLLAEEIDAKMQKSLLYRIPDSCHLFENVLDIFGDGKAAYNALLAYGSTYADKLQWAGAAACSDTAWCIQHQQHCPIATGASCRAGGFPCQDFSAAGQRAGSNGKQAPVIAGFGRKAQRTANPILVIENVDNCPRDLVYDTFGNDFSWCVEAVFSPADVGFEFIQRRRLGGPKVSLVSSQENNVPKPFPWQALHGGCA